MSDLPNDGTDPSETIVEPKESARQGPNPYLLGDADRPAPVFVTELHLRDDEHYTVPVVKETGDKLIETGTNSLQKTLLVKKEVELDDLDAELAAKRREFDERMAACEARRQRYEARQLQMKEQIVKFEKFVEDNEAKRRRAMSKYAEEERLTVSKGNELIELSGTLTQLQERRDDLAKSCKEYSKYSEFMNDVIAMLPENYLEASDNMTKSLMLRHSTLLETNSVLRNNLNTFTDELESSKHDFNETSDEHVKEVMESNSSLKRLQADEEGKRELVKHMDEQANRSGLFLRDRYIDYGNVLASINNMASQCNLRYNVFDGEPQTVAEKLHLIKEFYKKQHDVSRAAPRITSAQLTGRGAITGVKTTTHSRQTNGS